MLSSFSLRPTQERLYILQSLTHSILSESQMKAYSNEQQEDSTSSFGKPEKCRDPNCRCDSSCSDDAENCSAAAENNRGSPLHPLLRRGIKGISYTLVKDLVGLLECVRCKAFQFNYFDWYKISSELNDYLNAYIRNANAVFYNEDMGYPKSHAINMNPLFHHGGDDMDTESPSDEDVMDYESPASDMLSGNFPLVSSEGISIHQSPLTVPFKQEQTSCSSWTHSKPESVPPLKTSPLFVDSMDFAPKGMVKHPPHICQSSKSSSFNPLINSNIGANSNTAKEMHGNFMNSNVRNVHVEHRHTTKSVHSTCASNLTVAGATEAMLRSVIMNNSPVTDGFASTSNSFMTRKNNSGVPFGIAVHGSHMSAVQSHSPQYSAYPHEMSNPLVKSPEIANLSLSQVKQHHLPSSPNAGIHQSKPLPSCVPSVSSKEIIEETFVPRSNISGTIQNVSRTASNISVPHNVFSQNITRPSNLGSDMESGNKVHGHHGSNYMQQGKMPLSSTESLLLSTQERNISNVLSDSREMQGNMLLSLLENRKTDLFAGTHSDSSALNSASHKVPDRLHTDESAEGGDLPSVPLSFLPENKAPDVLLPETTELKAKSLNTSEQNSAPTHTTCVSIPLDASEGQVCSKIPIPVSVNRIPITKMTVEQLNSHEEKKTIPAFKISMPPDMKKPFRNWFFPANLVIPKNSSTGGDSVGESNSECLLEGNAKPSENNAISIPGFIVFKSNKGRYFSPSPKVVAGESGTACQTTVQKKIWTSFQSGDVSSQSPKAVAEESGNACQTTVQKKIWTSFQSGEVSSRRMSGSDVNIGAPVQNVNVQQPEKYPSASVQEGQQDIENKEQRFFQSATGPPPDNFAYISQDHSVFGAEHETHQFFAGSGKSDASLPSPADIVTSKVSALKTASCHQTSSVPSNVPHVISVLGKDIHPGLSVCNERKMPPQIVSVGSSDKNLPLIDTQNSVNKLERLGSPSVSTDKMCCSENEVVPCQSCSLSAAQALRNDQSLKAGLSQRRDAAGVKPSGTSNMNSKSI